MSSDSSSPLSPTGQPTRISSKPPVSDVFHSAKHAAAFPVRKALKAVDKSVEASYMKWCYWGPFMPEGHASTLDDLYSALVDLRNDLRIQTATISGSVKAVPKLWKLRAIAAEFSDTATLSSKEAMGRAQSLPPMRLERSTSSGSDTNLHKLTLDSEDEEQPERTLHELLFDDKFIEELRGTTKRPELLDLLIKVVDLERTADRDRPKFRNGTKQLVDQENIVPQVAALPKIIIKFALDMFERAIKDVGDRVSDAAGSNEAVLLRSRFEGVVRGISHKARILPPSMFLEGVKIYPHLHAARGGAASVYKGSFGEMDVAVKIVHQTHLEDFTNQPGETGMEQFNREAIIWQQASSFSNVQPLIGVAQHLPAPAPRGPGMVSSWCKNGSLRKYLAEKARRNESVDRIRILERIANALRCMHNHKPPLIHKDLKQGNIVVNDDGEPCLTDFGISTFSSSFTISNEYASSGTLRWMAPEILEDPNTTNQQIRERITPACDMYAFACVCYETYTLKSPWQGEIVDGQPRMLSDVQIREKVLAGMRPSRPPGDVIPNEVWLLMEKCWVNDPQIRMTAAAAQKDLADMLSPS
ncbi:kinase-like protein [Neolentinus lepideus HHB14362 ss-1]|uniref:Kinase-like protein n=1 Tax=Neolentinus lepideus HHB14362 ss-1 TaxID=1314782 RepID=A0A165V3M5_9AGAM|nr:kinase-like protein [Neolentinus lepideus HHB14362 ss-1]